MKGWTPRNWPLSLQLSVSFTLITLIALGGGGLLLANQVASHQLAARSIRGLAQARLVATLVSEHRFSQKPEELSPALFTFHQQSGVRPILVDKEGTVIADSWIPSPFMGQRLDNREVAQALLGLETVAHYQAPDAGWLLYAAVPINRGGQVDGAVVVSASLQDLAANLHEMRNQLLWALAIASLLAVGTGVGLSRYLSSPLERLWKAASAMGEGHLETQVAITGSREVGELGRRFNAMAAELRRIDEQRRNFVASASHELRTPIASIRALADALLADTNGNLDLYKECLQDMVNETDRAGNLMNRLLELARLEGRSSLIDGGAKSQVHRIDLRESCLNVLESIQPQARERGVDLHCLAKDPYWIEADDWLIETALTNLVQNGVKYTQLGGEVRLSITRGPSQNRHGREPGEAIPAGEARSVGLTTGAKEIWIQVIDTGPGIPPDHLAHLFDRFYRVEGSRSRTTGGIGLGLSIAAEAARLLSGRIEVESALGKGSRFSLVLPENPGGAARSPS